MKRLKRYKISEHGGLVEDENGSLVLYRDVEHYTREMLKLGQEAKLRELYRYG